jgi:hypothetical protein
LRKWYAIEDVKSGCLCRWQDHLYDGRGGLSVFGADKTIYPSYVEALTAITRSIQHRLEYFDAPCQFTCRSQFRIVEVSE